MIFTTLTLTREKIMDLVAYVVARGNPDHEYFRGGHVHDHGGDASEAGHEHKEGKH